MHSNQLRIQLNNVKLCALNSLAKNHLLFLLNRIFINSRTALEKIFADKITKKRKDELNELKKIKYLDSACVYLWATTPGM